jgi:hypothetical protein
VDFALTIRDLWNSTHFFGVLGVLLLALLVWLYRDGSFASSLFPIVLAGAIFWGIVATFALWLGWDRYYQYLYPTWVRPFAPLDALLYAGITFGLWVLAVKLPGLGILWFVLLGAIEGVLEHILGIYGMKILDKVPWLLGLPAAPVMVFSFFEYILYWDLVALLGWLLSRF